MTETVTSTRDLGILPNSVIRDAHASAYLVFITLADGIDEGQMKSWLTDVGGRIDILESHQGRDEPYASAVFGLGPKFFGRYPQYAPNNPVNLGYKLDLPALLPNVDAFVYIMSTSEQQVADFLTGLWSSHPATVSMIDVERGYQRTDKREPFGNLDGLRRPAPDQRAAVALIDRSVLPEEPAWLAGGSYAVYLKIEQLLAQWQTLDPAAQEGAIGRRRSDGSRLDLPEGTSPLTESVYENTTCPAPTSHVRKAGPRGPVNDQNQIFRRGVPYVEATADGIHTGLQFVSFQATPAYFDVIFNHWMLGPDFPALGTGQDDLVRQNLITFLKSGLFVIPPVDGQHPAAGYFELVAPTPSKGKTGRIHIRKQVLDANGNPTRAEMGGIQIAIFDATGAQQLGDTVITDPAGNAVTDALPLGATVLVRELLGGDSRFEPAADIPVTLAEENQVVHLTNRLKAAAPAYGPA